jgi:hypothetical protein
MTACGRKPSMTAPDRMDCRLGAALFSSVTPAKTGVQGDK